MGAEPRRTWVVDLAALSCRPAWKASSSDSACWNLLPPVTAMTRATAHPAGRSPSGTRGTPRGGRRSQPDVDSVTCGQRQQHHFPEAKEGLQGKVASDADLKDEEASAGQRRQVADPRPREWSLGAMEPRPGLTS